MKTFSIILSAFIYSIVLVFAGGGSFDKDKENSYKQIIIGAVSDVRVVAMINNLPASVEDVKNTQRFKLTKIELIELFYIQESLRLRRQSRDS